MNLVANVLGRLLATEDTEITEKGLGAEHGR